MDTVLIGLCNIPFLDTTYKHVIDFENKESRDNWFDNRVLKTIESNLKYDCNRTTVVVDMNIQQANDYDYLIFDGPDRRFFYFITSVEYNTPNTTLYALELDVFNTYYYDVYLQNSFVDRCHVNRWDGNIPTYNVEDEGVAIGEYTLLGNPIELYKMKKSLVVATSVPIGITENSTGSGSSGSSGSGAYGGTSWRDGKISSQGFAFIKGFEGFCATPYQDSGGYWTIGYGITQHGEPDLYQDLCNQDPLTEEYAAQKAYERICNSYGKKILQTCIDIGVTEQYQFDALVSLAYNSGTGSVTGENSLMQTIANTIDNQDAIMSAWQSFKVTSNGVYQEGLYLRRIEESNMFCGLPFEIRTPVEVPSYQPIEGGGWLPQDDSYINDDSGESYNGHESVSNDFGSGWLVPVKGATVTSPWGWRNCPYHGRELHPGVDLGCPTGTPVLATKSGTVTRCGFHDEMGNYIYIDHGNGIITKYMHLSAFAVSLNDTVSRCQKIGEVGSTGNSTGPHLHWEFRNADNESCIPIPNKNTKGSTV